jgi:hypothetical protein
LRASLAAVKAGTAAFNASSANVFSLSIMIAYLSRASFFSEADFYWTSATLDFSVISLMISVTSICFSPIILFLISSSLDKASVSF